MYDPFEAQREEAGEAGAVAVNGNGVEGHSEGSEDEQTGGEQADGHSTTPSTSTSS